MIAMKPLIQKTLPSLFFAFRALLVVTLLCTLTPSGCYLDPEAQCSASDQCINGAICELSTKRCKCPTGQTSCDVGDTVFCVDLQTNSSHCGQCKRACTSNQQYCATGSCKDCEENSLRCSEGCFDGQTNRNHCGSCDNTCPTNSDCVKGKCVCPTGRQVCDGVCVDIQADVGNCGECKKSCSQDKPVCEKGVCKAKCSEPCGDSCPDKMSDRTHCGACNNTCQAGQECCKGSCVDVKTSTSHCGSCNNACESGANCESGKCSCPKDTLLCGGSCIDVQTDPKHCGACDKACPSGLSCSQGLCCPQGQTNCQGVCVDLDNDPWFCGRCEHSCLGEACVKGDCESCKDDSSCLGNLTCNLQNKRCVCGPLCGWVQVASGTSAEIVPLDLQIDGRQHIFVAGRWKGEGKLGVASHKAGVSSDIFVAKLDPLGRVLWLKVVESSGQSEARSLVLTSNSVVVTGVYAGSMKWGSTTLSARGSQDLFVGALSLSGTPLWSLTAGDKDASEGIALVAENDNSLYVTGTFQTRLGFGTTTLSSAAGVEGFVAKITVSANQPRWSWAVAPGGQLMPTSLALQGSTRLVLGGSYQADISIPGKDSLKNNGSRTLVLLIMKRSDGTVSQGLGALGNAVVRDVTVCPSGLVYAAGSFQGSTKIGTLVLQPESSSDPGDIFIAELDANLVVKRTLSFPDKGLGEVHSMGCAEQTLWLAGTFEQSIQWRKDKTSTSMGKQDTFVAQLDLSTTPDMTFVTGQTVGSSDDDIVRAIAVDNWGGVFVVGSLKGEVTFPIKPKPQAIPLVGQQSSWLWKVTP